MSLYLTYVFCSTGLASRVLILGLSSKMLLHIMSKKEFSIARYTTDVLLQERGMNAFQKTISTVLIILALNYAFSDGICNQDRTPLAVVGVFDFEDSASLNSFERAIARYNSLKFENCVPRLTYTTIILKKEMSIKELMDHTDIALRDGPCFMVYASEDSNARIVLDVATRQELNIITAVQVSHFLILKLAHGLIGITVIFRSENKNICFFIFKGALSRYFGLTVKC